MGADGPQVLYGVGPPRTPPLGVLDQRPALGQAELPGQDDDAEIGWQEGIGVAEGAALAGRHSSEQPVGHPPLERRRAHRPHR